MGEDTNEERPKELRFAPTEKTDRYEHLLPDFLMDVLGFDPEDADSVFVSEGSSLRHFHTYGQGPKSNEAELALWRARIEERYGVDVSDIEDGNLVRILARIEGTD